MRAETVVAMIISGFSAFSLFWAAAILTHEEVFSCAIKTTLILNNATEKKHVISEGRIYFKQYLMGGVGYYDGLLKYRDRISTKTGFVNISFETGFQWIGRVLRLKTNFLDDGIHNEFYGIANSNFMPPYIKNDAVNHITIGYSERFGFTIGSELSPSFICN